jgi:hypothetical protein
MACVLSSGFLLDCNEGVGGVKEIFIAPWNAFAAGVTQDGDGIITDFTVAAPVTVYRYQPNRNTGAVTITPTANLENGTLYFVQAVELTLGKLDNDKRKELENLSKAKVAVFVRLYDDQIMMAGTTDGCFLTAGTYQSGKAKGDLNGYTLTLTAEEPTQPLFLEPYTAGDTPFSNFAPDIVVSPAYA